MGIRRMIKNYKKRSATGIEYFGLTVAYRGPQFSDEIREHLIHKAYEIHEIKGLRAVIRPADTVLELGTGLGIITSLAARAAHQGRVVSFEANAALIADAAQLLQSNAIANAEIRHGILAKTPTTATSAFHIAPSFAESSLRPMAAAVQTVDVPTHDLDQTIDTVRPDILICDIEGAEADLVPQINFAAIRAAVIELHPNVLADADVARIYDHMIAHGLYPKIQHSGGTVVVFERIG